MNRVFDHKHKISLQLFCTRHGSQWGPGQRPYDEDFTTNLQWNKSHKNAPPSRNASFKGLYCLISCALDYGSVPMIIQIVGWIESVLILQHLNMLAHRITGNLGEIGFKSKFPKHFLKRGLAWLAFLHPSCTKGKKLAKVAWKEKHYYKVKYLGATPTFKEMTLKFTLGSPRPNGMDLH